MSIGPANRRHDLRRVLPRLRIHIDNREFLSRDWSLGGFGLLEEVLKEVNYQTGDEVAGFFTISGHETVYPFQAEMVRVDNDHGVAGFHFTELAPETFSILERMLLRPEPKEEEDPDKSRIARKARVQEKRQPDKPGDNWFTRLGIGGRR